MKKKTRKKLWVLLSLCVVAVIVLQALATYGWSEIKALFTGKETSQQKVVEKESEYTKYLDSINALNTQAALQAMLIQNLQSQVVVLNLTIQNRDEIIISRNSLIASVTQTKDAEIAGLNNQIAELESQVDADISELTALIAERDQTILDKNIEIARIIIETDTEIATLNGQILNLQADIAERNETIANMAAEASVLQDQINNLTANNSMLSSQVELLNALMTGHIATINGYQNTINQLNNLVSYLEGVISFWENRAEYVATFYIKNGTEWNVWDIQIIETKNTAPGMPPEPKGNFDFVGWSTDSVTVVDPTKVLLNGDMNFYAVIDCTVTFIANSEIYATQTIRQNGFAAMPAGTMNWSLDGETAVNPTEIIITENTTFVALIECTVTFGGYRNGPNASTIFTWETYTVKQGALCPVPAVPKLDWYTFKGWGYEAKKLGTNADATPYIIDLSTLIITENITLYTVYNSVPM